MADWTSSASVSSRPACRSIAALRPPPARRTRPPRWFSPPRRSANPRPMVLRATAVASHTAFTPPRPAVSASLAATSRRPRSSRPAFVKERRDGLKTRLDGGDIDHLPKIPHRRSRNIYILILLLRSTHNPDSFQPIRLFRPNLLSFTGAPGGQNT